MRVGIWALLFLAATLSGCAGRPDTMPPVSTPVSERARAQVDLARGYLNDGDVARARGPIERALELAPELVEAHVLAGVMYERTRETALAEHHFNAALNLDPDHAQALNNYGAFLYGQGRLEAALRPLRLAASDPGYRLRAQAFENLGLTELGLGRDDAAKFAFERALALADSQPRSRLELAGILYLRGEYKAAEHHYHAFLAQADETSRSLCLGLRLGGAPGATRRSADHAQRLRNQYPQATSACP